MAASTREQLRKMLEKDPNLRAPEAADALGISRQRVYQLMDALGVERMPQTPGPAVHRSAPTAVPRRVSSAAAAELLVAADLLERGLQVFAPIARDGLSSILMTLDAKGKVERIGVSLGRSAGPTKQVFDRMASVVPGEPIAYRPAYREPAMR